VWTNFLQHLLSLTHSVVLHFLFDVDLLLHSIAVFIFCLSWLLVSATNVANAYAGNLELSVRGDYDGLTTTERNGTVCYQVARIEAHHVILLGRLA